jgi:CheY-like chemotaxis protein
VQLIDDLLDVSRIVAGKLPLTCGPVDLGDAVRAVMADVSGLISDKALAVRVSVEPALGPIWADRTRVPQVVGNLLTNAIKFTPKGGRITLTVDRVGGLGRLRVSDTGVGIDPAFLPHLFRRFTQSDSSITRTHGGLGLGLALVRHLVELQGGTASAQSPGPGLGATFEVTFPMARVSDRPSAVPGPPNLRHALDRPGRTQRYEALAGLKVLFIDDDQRTREAVYEVLKFTGAQIELAASAAEGMAVVERSQPQVILCDIAMPDEDGYTFMRKLRAREQGRAPTPALALTAMATEDDRRRAIAAGFQLHLAKPIDIDRLRDAVLDLAKLAPPAQ